jgi:hydroxymethylbilane synthase
MGLDRIIKIGTRASKLALWQAHFVKDLINKQYPSLQVELVPMTTTGDEKLEITLNKVGGKGLFLKEIEEALIDKKVDLAVHSMKDVPNILPDGLEIICYLQRENPFDVLVTNSNQKFLDLPSKSIIGSSSLRRICQLKKIRNDLIYKPLRGNVQTRLKKLDDGEFDAIVLAAAGLKRLALEDRIFEELKNITPASGQGVVSIEVRSKDDDLKKLLKELNDPISSKCVKAERIFLKKLQGGCQTPIGAYVEKFDEQTYTFEAFLSNLDGSKTIYHQEEILSSLLESRIEEITDKIFLGEKGRGILEEIKVGL